MRIPKTIKRIGNITVAFFLAMCCIIVGISAVKTSRLNLKEVDVFTGKVIEKGITRKKSSVAGKGNMVLDVFYLRLEGLDQVLGTYNPKRDYKKLDENIEVGNIIKVYFKKNYTENQINTNTFQIEKDKEILLSKDSYQFREGIAGYLGIIGGIVMIGIALYQDKKYWKKKKYVG